MGTIFVLFDDTFHEKGTDSKEYLDVTTKKKKNKITDLIKVQNSTPNVEPT